MAQANSGEFQTPECRLAFSDGLFEARSVDGVKFNFGATLIFDNKHRKYFEEIVEKLVQLKWGDKGIANYKAGRIKSPLLAGDGPAAHSKQSGDLWAGFGPDVFFIRANANQDQPPRVLFRSKHVDATKDEVYSGCYGRAVLNGYTWENPTGGHGVSFGIRIFQKVRDGDSLGGRGPVNVDKWFIDVPDETPGDHVDIFE